MKPTPAQLRDDIETGPDSATLLPLFQKSNDQQIADFYSQVTGTQKKTVLTKGEVFLSIMPAVARLQTLTIAPKKEFWVNVLNILRSVDVLDVTRPQTVSLLNQAVTDGLLTMDELNAIGMVPATRAELRWGPGAVVTVDLVGRARSEVR
ncbi:MAG: hypothetical protein KatS3mg105_5027 [Gemmatales bacterium]|nr:MAG: hypothetical protein KatS3mg105_5027 [Gemmatales bacterium]